MASGPTSQPSSLEQAAEKLLAAAEQLQRGSAAQGHLPLRLRDPAAYFAPQVQAQAERRAEEEARQRQAAYEQGQREYLARGAATAPRPAAATAIPAFELAPPGAAPAPAQAQAATAAMRAPDLSWLEQFEQRRQARLLEMAEQREQQVLAIEAQAALQVAQKRQAAADERSRREQQLLELEAQAALEVAQKRQAAADERSRREQELLELEARAALQVARKQQAAEADRRQALLEGALADQERQSKLDLALRQRYLATPQGQREQQVAQHGRLNVALGNLSSAASKVAGGFNQARMALAMFEGTVLGLVAKASPNTLATYQESWDLLQARIGTMMVPAVEEMSRTLQAAARLAEKAQAVPGVGTVAGGLGRGFFGAGGLIVTLLDSLTGGDQELKRSMQGLIVPRVGMGAEEAYQAMQRDVLLRGPLEQEKLNEQMKNLAEILKGVETVIGDNTQALKEHGGAWR